MLLDYLKERDGVEVLLADGGFLTYLIAGDQLYIADFYLDEKHRASKEHFLSFMRRALVEGVSRGCKMFTCHVGLSNKNLNEVVVTRLRFGFRITGVENNSLAMVLPFERCAWAKQ